MDTKNKILLFVDKDPFIQTKYEHVFSDTGFKVFFVSEMQEAIDMFEKRNINIMIFDLNLSESRDVGFVKYIKENYPETLRIALNSECEKKDIMSFVDNNLIKMHILKPCKPEELKSIVVRLSLLYDEFKSEGLQKVISDLVSLPTLPDLYKRITDMVEKDSNIEEITKVIEEDQSISTRILKMANSAFYAAKTGSIQMAIMFIGLFNVKNIVLTNSIFKEIGAKRPEVGMSWKHVSLTNKLLGKVYKYCYGKNIPNNYASVGLLHDIGKVIFLSHFGDKYEDLLIQMTSGLPEEANTCKLIVREKEMFGTDHQKLGAYLLDWWAVPLPLVEAAMYHHDPLNENIINKELVMAVHIASFYASEAIYGENGKFCMVEEVLQRLNVKKENLEQVIGEIKLSDMDDIIL